MKDQARHTESAWRFLLPWVVLPVALAIIAVADWLRHADKAKGAAKGAAEGEAEGAASSGEVWTGRNGRRT
jgi:hypothetical protein